MVRQPAHRKRQQSRSDDEHRTLHGTSAGGGGPDVQPQLTHASAETSPPSHTMRQEAVRVPAAHTAAHTDTPIPTSSQDDHSREQPLSQPHTTHGSRQKEPPAGKAASSKSKGRKRQSVFDRLAEQGEQMRKHAQEARLAFLAQRNQDLELVLHDNHLLEGSSSEDEVQLVEEKKPRKSAASRGRRKMSHDISTARPSRGRVSRHTRTQSHMQ